MDVEWKRAEIVGEVVVQHGLQLGACEALGNHMVDIHVEKIARVAAPAAPIIPGIPKGAAQDEILR